MKGRREWVEKRITGNSGSSGIVEIGRGPRVKEEQGKGRDKE